MSGNIFSHYGIQLRPFPWHHKPYLPSGNVCNRIKTVLSVCGHIIHTGTNCQDDVIDAASDVASDGISDDASPSQRPTTDRKSINTPKHSMSKSSMRSKRRTNCPKPTEYIQVGSRDELPTYLSPTQYAQIRQRKRSDVFGDYTDILIQSSRSPTTGAPAHGKETVQEPSPSIPNLPVQTTRLKPSQPEPELPGGHHSKRLIGGSGAPPVAPSMPVQSQPKPFQSTPNQPTHTSTSNKGPVKGRFPLTSILRKPSVAAIRRCDPPRRRKSVTWAASPVLNAIRWIESREDLRRAEEQAQSKYRPPFVSER
ncbi:hypothetical protein B0T13DRAFT_525251 [Neurospora crassa]|nr:hypothetical protein B0T13DRAFT_525251 [Neurospora crassa]